ncbi:MAG: LuxR C-terminal-related transcriptional regulator [Gammaproteobacteria bacterium]|nr:LuxR C-terminal-related transcriptional regulator [Gammaproteobacteria bacterium]
MRKSKLSVYEPNENFYKNHVTFTSVNEIKKISVQLQQVGISYFTFDRTYKDGSHVRLTNAGRWIESYYREKLYDVAIFEKNPKLFADGYVFWALLKREPVYSAASEHNIDHGITITQSHETYCDFFHFGTARDNYLSPEILVSKLSYLYSFIAFFNERAKKIITESENTRFILPIKALTDINLDDIRNNPSAIDILKKPEISRLYLGAEFDNTYLTRREIEILAMMMNGNKSVYIAKQCQMSEKTLESHVKSIKGKLKCNTLFELGYITSKLSIQHIFSSDLNIGEKNGVVARYN